MQIGTNYNVASAQTKVTPKAKETGSSDQLVLGGNVTDNSLTMADQLKNMKSYDSSIANACIGAGVGSVVGGVIGSLGTAVVVNIAGGVGGWGTLGLSLIGGAVGTVVGSKIGYNIK